MESYGFVLGSFKYINGEDVMAGFAFVVQVGFFALGIC